jgi:TPR repeat protein
VKDGEDNQAIAFKYFYECAELGFIQCFGSVAYMYYYGYGTE